MSNLRIEINEDMETYKEDFFRGMNRNETIGMVLLLILNLGGVMVALFVLYIPVIIAIYVLLPADIMIGLIGFYPSKQTGKSFPEFIRLAWKLRKGSGMHYSSSEFTKEKDIRYEKMGPWEEVRAKVTALAGDPQKEEKKREAPYISAI